jgi:hypothetical protein
MLTMPQPRPPPHLLTELAPEQFNVWRHHPVTRLVFDDYLEALAFRIEVQVLNGWLSGNLTLDLEQEARGRLLAYRLLVQNLNLPIIREEYGLPGTAER